MTFQNLLDPANLDEIADYNLLARTAANGFLSGLHRSLTHGKGTEFFQYRSYAPGEDMKFVDWKVYGKQNRLVTKTFETETNTACYIVIDNSLSMDYKGERSSCSKLRYASMLAATLAHLAISQGDSVGLAVYSDKIHEWIEPRYSMGQLGHFMKSLVRVKAQGKADHTTNWSSLTRQLSGRGIIIFLSDMLGGEDELPSILKFANTWRYDCMAIQILDPDELDLPFKGGVIFEDLEGSQQITTNPETISPEYKKKMEKFLLDLKERLFKTGVDYYLMTTEINLGYALRRYLNIREKRH